MFVSTLELAASAANAGAIFDDDPLGPQQILINRPCEEGNKETLEIRLDAFGCPGLQTADLKEATALLEELG